MQNTTYVPDASLQALYVYNWSQMKLVGAKWIRWMHLDRTYVMQKRLITKQITTKATQYIHKL